MQDLTLEVTAIMRKTAAAPSRPPSYRRMHFQPADFPAPQQSTYRKIAQLKKPKIIPLSLYMKEPTKLFLMATVVQAAESHCDTGTDPMTDVLSFDSIARGASTTGNYSSAAIGLTRRSDYLKALSTSAITNPSLTDGSDG